MQRWIHCAAPFTDIDRNEPERRAVPAFRLWRQVQKDRDRVFVDSAFRHIGARILRFNRLQAWFWKRFKSGTMASSQSSNASACKTFAFIFLLCTAHLICGQLRYSIPEEMEQGAFVGNIAGDLELNVRQLSARKFRLASDDGRQYMKVSLDNGVLSLRERIDREHICGPLSSCILPFEILIENPLEMYRGEVEILDLNDNSPSFADSIISLEMAESIAPGVRFPLDSAQDPDVGANTVAAYRISTNAHFGLAMQTSEDGIKSAELLLEKPLDREQQSSFQLVLTAIDGGIPPRSGTAQILITVLDSNDNPPVFDQAIYRSTLTENAALGTLVIKVSANDLDEGPNAEVTYSFSKLASPRVRELFSLDQHTGEIRVETTLDFEDATSYSLDVQAVDNGYPVIAGHAKVLIKVIDVNDNAPEIKATSVSSMVSEDVSPGTVITLINVIDRDSGVNGEVHCQIPKNLPFKLQKSSSNRYKLVTTGLLDRENVPMYHIPVLARDSGSPALSTNKTIQISVSDVNDNAPRFTQMSYTVYVMENNAPGASIFAVAALDPDTDQNSHVSYAMMANLIQDLPTSHYINVNSKNGEIYALRSFDYEQLKTFQIQVQARDAGVPSLSSSATVNVIILDQNDNVPVIVSPPGSSGSAAVEIVPQSAGQGYLVTKIIATDADSGQNARLSYQVLKATDPSLFNVGLNSGEIRTARGILEQDATTQSLVIQVKDNGQPSLSSTVTALFSILDNVTEIFSESSNLVRNPEYVSDLNLYLIIALGSTTLIFLVTIIFLVAIKCTQDRNLIEGYNSPISCYRREDSNYTYTGRPTPTEPVNYTGVGQMVPDAEPYHYTVCLSPESSKTDFLYLKPYISPLPQEQC
uniref:protocadherin beta-15-like n=1 Tax=Pristiophorus japonicus TaxID=55135 RepID=UPI00398ED3B0